MAETPVTRLEILDGLFKKVSGVETGVGRPLPEKHSGVKESESQFGVVGVAEVRKRPTAYWGFSAPLVIMA